MQGRIPTNEELARQHGYPLTPPLPPNGIMPASNVQPAPQPAPMPRQHPVLNSGVGATEIVPGGFGMVIDSIRGMFGRSQQPQIIQPQNQQYPLRAPITTSGGVRGADGGHVTGPGGPREDKIDAKLSAGEYIIPADVVKAVGKETFDALLRQYHTYGDGDMKPRHYMEGGVVEPDMRTNRGPGVSMGNEPPRPHISAGVPPPQASTPQPTLRAAASEGFSKAKAYATGAARDAARTAERAIGAAQERIDRPGVSSGYTRAGMDGPITTAADKAKLDKLQAPGAGMPDRIRDLNTKPAGGGALRTAGGVLGRLGGYGAIAGVAGGIIADQFDAAGQAKLDQAAAANGIRIPTGRAVPAQPAPQPAQGFKAPTSGIDEAANQRFADEGVARLQAMQPQVQDPMQATVLRRPENQGPRTAFDGVDPNNLVGFRGLHRGIQEVAQNAASMRADSRMQKRYQEDSKNALDRDRFGLDSAKFGEQSRANRAEEGLKSKGLDIQREELGVRERTSRASLQYQMGKDRQARSTANAEYLRKVTQENAGFTDVSKATPEQQKYAKDSERRITTTITKIGREAGLRDFNMGDVPREALPDLYQLAEQAARQDADAGTIKERFKQILLGYRSPAQSDDLRDYQPVSVQPNGIIPDVVHSPTGTQTARTYTGKGDFYAPPDLDRARQVDILRMRRREQN
jgi:hypothetical protein